jgi:hypothetical protein
LVWRISLQLTGIKKMTKEELQNLKDRMHKHTVVNDTALVIVSAQELEELIENYELAQVLIEEKLGVLPPLGTRKS